MNLNRLVLPLTRNKRMSVAPVGSLKKGSNETNPAPKLTPQAKAWEEYINPLPDPNHIRDPKERHIAELRVSVQRAKCMDQHLGEQARMETDSSYGKSSPYTKTKDLLLDGNPAEFLDPFPINPFNLH